MGTSAAAPAPFASAVSLRAALLAGEVTAVEVAAHFLERIAAREDLGAFVSVTNESALDAARAADAALATARSAPTPATPPLLGIPLAHKDLVDVAGAPTSSGSATQQARIAEDDHPVVAALRAAGSISLGKTQVPEFGLSCYSENLIAPPARNPFDRDRTPGGSSGGAAAAVAAGLLPFAPGSDGGGSVRIPALACGLVGLKPGLGAVPGDVTRGYEDSFGSPILTVSGPLARSAADAAMLMDAMATPNMRGAHREAVHRAADLTGLTVATSTASPFEAALDVPLSDDALRAFTVAAERLALLGHHVDAAEFNYDPEYFEFFSTGWTASLSLLDFDEAQAERLMPLTREMRERALGRSLTEHRAAGARLREFGRDVRGQWGNTDIVLTPGLAMAAPRIGEFAALPPQQDYELQCKWTPFTSMVNVAGLPAIAIPMFTDGGGLPVGVQLIGRAGSEPQLLAIAAQLEAF